MLEKSLNKVLIALNRSIIKRLYTRYIQSKNIDESYIITNRNNIQEVRNAFIDNVLIPKNIYESSSYRIAEYIESGIINVQNDKPFICDETKIVLVEDFKNQNVVTVGSSKTKYNSLCIEDYKRTLVFIQ